MRKETTKKQKSHIPKALANIMKFCEVLDGLPSNFTFKLSNVSKNFDGAWIKTVSNGATAWQNGSKVLFNSSFFHKKDHVLDAIEREGLSVRKLYFPETKCKVPLLRKRRVKELYYEQKKSLQDIAKEHGCTKQWVSLFMESRGMERRTHSEAKIEANKQGKG